MFAIVMCYWRSYVCCSECYVVSNGCNDHTPALCNLSVRTVVKLCTLEYFDVMIYACVL